MDGDLFTGCQRELLLDLRKVPVLGDAVGADALIAFGVQERHIRLAARTAHTAEAVGNDAGGFDQAGFQQWHGGQENAGGITAGRGDESCGPDIVPM